MKSNTYRFEPVRRSDAADRQRTGAASSMPSRRQQLSARRRVHFVSGPPGRSRQRRKGAAFWRGGVSGPLSGHGWDCWESINHHRAQHPTAPCAPARSTPHAAGYFHRRAPPGGLRGVRTIHGWPKGSPSMWCLGTVEGTALPGASSGWRALLDPRRRRGHPLREVAYRARAPRRVAHPPGEDDGGGVAQTPGLRVRRRRSSRSPQRSSGAGGARRAACPPTGGTRRLGSRQRNGLPSNGRSRASRRRRRERTCVATTRARGGLILRRLMRPAGGIPSPVQKTPSRSPLGNPDKPRLGDASSGYAPTNRRGLPT
jgi:hypothetical protein